MVLDCDRANVQVYHGYCSSLQADTPYFSWLLTHTSVTQNLSPVLCSAFMPIRRLQHPGAPLLLDLPPRVHLPPTPCPLGIFH